MVKKEFIKTKIGDLIPYENNPRHNEEAVPDVSVNIYAWLKAQATREPVELCCAIGDETIDGRPYEEIVRIAKTYIDAQGGFEKFAEWGLIRC